MRQSELAPYAPALIESMRAVGYSLELAVADLIDNSISAGASDIRIRFMPYDDPYVAIIDDGSGMSADELLVAMRHGSRNPNDDRAATDLGRFGLGLKTASLSQCRQLTVVSMKNGELSACRWDLDVIAETQAWTLQILDAGEIADLPQVEILKSQRSGTIVLWRSFDRLSAGEESVEGGLGGGMARVQHHLGLVFHRYLAEEMPKHRIRISMNEHPVPRIDPFLAGHRSTTRLPVEAFRIAGAEVAVQAYILPHYSKLSPEEMELAGGDEGLRRHQGFYIYRNRRLIIWGTWFRLARQEELTKLARVQVDIPNSLDHLWTLDIKKSTAYPPIAVRNNLARIIKRIGESSRKVYTHRGRRANSDRNIEHVWDRLKGRDGIMYRVNRAHPLIRQLNDALDPEQIAVVETVLRQIEETFPVEALYADVGNDQRHVRQRPEYDEERLLALAEDLVSSCGGDSERVVKLLESLPILEPFSFHPELARSIAERIRHGKQH